MVGISNFPHLFFFWCLYIFVMIFYCNVLLSSKVAQTFFTGKREVCPSPAAVTKSPMFTLDDSDGEDTKSVAEKAVQTENSAISSEKTKGYIAPSILQDTKASVCRSLETCLEILNSDVSCFVRVVVSHSFLLQSKLLERDSPKW